MHMCIDEQKHIMKVIPGIILITKSLNTQDISWIKKQFNSTMDDCNNSSDLSRLLGSFLLFHREKLLEYPKQCVGQRISE